LGFDRQRGKKKGGELASRLWTPAQRREKKEEETGSTKIRKARKKERRGLAL